MMTNTSMSLYHKITDNNKSVTYAKTLIKNVFWDDKIKIEETQGYNKLNEVDVYIPKNKNDLSNVIINKGDFIVKGNFNKENVSGIKELENAFTIKVIDDKDFGSPNMHHFYLKGE